MFRKVYFFCVLFIQGHGICVSMCELKLFVLGLQDKKEPPQLTQPREIVTSVAFIAQKTRQQQCWQRGLGQKLRSLPAERRQNARRGTWKQRKPQRQKNPRQRRQPPRHRCLRQQRTPSLPPHMPPSLRSIWECGIQSGYLAPNAKFESARRILRRLPEFEER